MKIALSFSIAASWPGLDLYQTNTFSERLPKLRERKQSERTLGQTQAASHVAAYAVKLPEEIGISEFRGKAERRFYGTCAWTVPLSLT